jgi:peptidoglycan/LPS O-acetylase OafA/YrhL
MALKSGRFVLLDGLRGLAAIGIVFYHVAHIDFPIFSCLFLLVDFFFVLSGFVLEPAMPNSQAKFWPQTRKFAFKRFLRFWPMLIVVLAFRVTACGALVWLGNSDAQYCGTASGGNYTVSLISAALLLQIVIPAARIFSVPLWSLSAEWFANLLAMPVTASKNRWVLPIGILVGYVTLVYGWRTNHTSQAIIFGFAALGRALVGFFMGLALRRWHNSRDRKFSLPGLVVAAATTVGLFAYQLTALPGVLILAAPVFALLVSQVAAIDEDGPNLNLRATASYLGWLSFGIYAWHENIRFLFKALDVPEAIDSVIQDKFLSSFLLFVLVLIVSAGFTHLTIRFIERPINNRWGKGKALKQEASRS